MRENNRDRSGGVGHCSGSCLLTRADFGSFKSFSRGGFRLSVTYLHLDLIATDWLEDQQQQTVPVPGRRTTVPVLSACRSADREKRPLSRARRPSTAQLMRLVHFCFLQRETSQGLRAAAAPVFLRFQRFARLSSCSITHTRVRRTGSCIFHTLSVKPGKQAACVMCLW